VTARNTWKTKNNQQQAQEREKEHLHLNGIKCNKDILLYFTGTKNKKITARYDRFGLRCGVYRFFSSSSSSPSLLRSRAKTFTLSPFCARDSFIIL